MKIVKTMPRSLTTRAPWQDKLETFNEHPCSPQTAEVQCILSFTVTMYTAVYKVQCTCTVDHKKESFLGKIAIDTIKWQWWTVCLSSAPVQNFSTRSFNVRISVWYNLYHTICVYMHKFEQLGVGQTLSENKKVGTSNVRTSNSEEILTWERHHSSNSSNRKSKRFVLAISMALLVASSASIRIY